MLTVALLLLLQVKPADESILVKVVENARLPHLVFDPDGNPCVAFVRNGNIEIAVSTDGGKTFGAPVVAINTGGRDAGIQNRGPRVSIDRGKRIYVSAPLPGSAPATFDLAVAVSTDHGKTFSKPNVVGPAQGAHAAAAGPNDVHLAWLDGKTLAYVRVDAGGKRIGKITPVTGLACDNCPPGLAVDPGGHPTLAWRENKSPRSVYLSRSTDGGKSFAPSTQLNSIETGLTECPQDAPAAAVSADGKFLAVAWMDRRDVERDADVYWSFGPPGKLSPDTDCLDDRRFQQRRPALAVDADGAVWCAWEDGRLSTLRVFFTNSKTEDNIPLGTSKEGPGSWPSLVAGGGKVAIAYQFGKDIGFRVLATR